jgi:hypothetical protein
MGGGVRPSGHGSVDPEIQWRAPRGVKNGRGWGAASARSANAASARSAGARASASTSIRSQRKECGGSSICPHQCIKSKCKKCREEADMSMPRRARGSCWSGQARPGS